jgi:hypothetical protein
MSDVCGKKRKNVVKVSDSRGLIYAITVYCRLPKGHDGMHSGELWHNNEPLPCKW